MMTVAPADPHITEASDVGTVFLQGLSIAAFVVAFMASLQFLQRFLELRHEKRGPAALDALQARLDRIEAAVESTAVEVERISEANRFMSKVLAERAGAPHQ